MTQSEMNGPENTRFIFLQFMIVFLMGWVTFNSYAQTVGWET